MAQAIISDIHSNIEALTAVLDHIKGQGIKEIICLGDLVGYGPNPAEVVKEAMEWKLVMLGNHDQAVVRSLAYGFNAQAKKAVAWTRDQLSPNFLSAREKKERWEFLKNLPYKQDEDEVFFAHASPRELYHNTEYILAEDAYIDFLGEVPGKIKQIFTMFQKLCFVGHSHFPGVLTERAEYLEPKEFNDKFVFENGKKYLINVGSVGQPRDSDIRACYVVFDGNGVTFHRVEYDYKKTQEKIFNTPALDRRSGERLAVGL